MTDDCCVEWSHEKILRSILDIMFRRVLLLFKTKLANVLINNLYIHFKTCESPSTTSKTQISHILETEPTHATEYNKKRFFKEKDKYQQSIYR